MKRLLFLFLIFSLKSFGQKDTEIIYTSLDQSLSNPSIVKRVDLSETNLDSLPFDILKLTHLEKIDLSLNPNLDLTQTFDILKQIESLKILWLTEGKIKTIPDNISQLNNLEELWLDDNELTTFPEPVKKLKNLKYLRLFSNKIKRLSFKENELPNLIDIDLCYNEFETFPIELSVLKNLKRIIIWYNSIKEIPKSIKYFKYVEEVNLEGNNLSILPKEFSKLKSLQKLSLRGNQLTSKTIKPIYKIVSLKDLDLQSNDIANLSKKIRSLKYLTRLSISDNPLTQLPNELQELKNIKQLGLGDLHNLNWTSGFLIMEKLPNLRQVGMYTMKLSTMPLGFDRLQQVDTFWLTYNLFDNKEKKRIKNMVPKAKVEFE